MIQSKSQVLLIFSTYLQSYYIPIICMYLDITIITVLIIKLYFFKPFPLKSIIYLNKRILLIIHNIIVITAVIGRYHFCQYADDVHQT